MKRKRRQPFIEPLEEIKPLLTPREIRAGLLAAIGKPRRGGPDRAVIERLLAGRYWLAVARWDIQPELLTEHDISRMFAPWFLGLSCAVRDSKRFKWHTVKTAGGAAVASFEAHWWKVSNVKVDYSLDMAA